MTAFSRRIGALELAVQAANRVGLAELFDTQGDPRDNPTWLDLTADEQVSMLWHFNAWKADAHGFLVGFAPHHCVPTPDELHSLLATMWRGTTPAEAAKLIALADRAHEGPPWGLASA